LNNRDISQVLENIALALELLSDNPFRAKAYSSAARIVASHKDPVEQLAREGRLADLKGVGKSVAASIGDIVETGSSPLLNELLNEIPPDVWRMLSLPGLGPKRVKKLWRELGVSTLDELDDACKQGRLLSIEGFGEKLQSRIRNGIESLRRNEGRLLLGAALQIADEFTEKLAGNLSGQAIADYVHARSGSADAHSGPVHAGEGSARISLEITGAVRRKCETVDAIEILATAAGLDSAGDVNRVFEKTVDGPVQPADMQDCQRISGLGRSDAIYSMSAEFRGARVIVHVRPPGISAQSLFLLTGSGSHVDSCTRLSPGLLSTDRQFAGEQEIYSAFSLAYVPPEMREDTGEIELAKDGRIPRLVEESDIKGILHVHTNYSDGSNSIEDIARYCLERGYEYVGIADHSRSAFYADGLSESDLRKQHEEIREVQSRLTGIKIFHGIESDILADGSLDYDDETLAILDFVIGSVHSRFSMSREAMTSRVIKAIRNPYLTILGHPTGRLLLTRDPYQIDLKAVLEALAEEGKAVELNADPHRLDLDWRHCMIAKRMGIPVSINPDAHDIRGIENTRYGVAIGRKGWLSAADVLNCLTAHEISAEFRSKRDAQLQ
jgi:DNA polymerase (family 10)